MKGGDEMLLKKVAIAVVLSLFVAASVSAQQRGTPAEAKKMVEAAIAYIKAYGQEKAFSEINNPNGRFVDRDLYIMVYDMDGTCLAHGHDKERIGKNFLNAPPEVDGKFIVKERVIAAKTKASGWQDYRFNDPLSKRVERKTVYFERYGDIIVSCGAYMSMIDLASTLNAPAEATGPQSMATEVQKKCQGRFKNKEVSVGELATLLRDHGAWLDVYRNNSKSKEALSDSRRANLCGAKLTKVHLTSANLTRADLSGADLIEADLREAVLTEADMRGVELFKANLSGAQLNNATLSGGNLSRATWRRADMTGANLSGAQFYKSNLVKTVLSEADLSGVDLTEADLSEGILIGANLSGAELAEANLSGAALYKANLSGAQLYKANLFKAVLSEANLSGAVLTGANLNGVILIGANLSGATFEPSDLPGVDLIADADNLAMMVFKKSPKALVKLRKEFKESGYQQHEHAITYAIKHTETMTLLGQDSIASIVEGVFQYIFFDITTRWGMTPGRALIIALILIPVFAIPYVIALQRPGENGILRDRGRASLGSKEPERLQLPWPESLGVGLYFSLLSAFNIGWHELNVGNWIQRLQTDEYTLRATGWVRTVSGVQSLVSIYLVALWALTYFGRPFD